MKIGILGTGHIGKTLVRKLSAAGHDVRVANSRGPDTIEPDVLAFGGRAVTAAEAVADVDVVILSIPLNRLPEVAPLIATVPSETVVIATSNYYPQRDGRIDAIEAGQVESLWVAEQLGRPIEGVERDRVRLFCEEGEARGEPGPNRDPHRGRSRNGSRGGDGARRGHRVRRLRRGHACGLVAAAARRALLLHGSHPRGDAGRMGGSRCGAIT